MAEGDDAEDDGDGASPPEAMAGRSRSLRQARKHFTLSMVGALVVLVLFAAMNVLDVGSLVRESWNVSNFAPPPQAGIWAGLFLVAALGALAERAHAIAYYGFKVQEYEPLTWRYHIAVGFRATLVAVAFVALGQVVTAQTLVDNEPFALAFAFAAGYFGEPTFEVFQQRFRQLIGNEQGPRKSVRKAVEGVDVPIDELGEVHDPDLRALLGLREDVRAGEVVAKLQEAGLTSSREIVAASLTSGGTDEMHEALDGLAPDDEEHDEGKADVERLVQLANLQRTGVPAPLAVELLLRGGVEGIGDLVDPRVLVEASEDLDGGFFLEGEPGPERGAGPFAELIAKRARRLTETDRR